MRALGTDTLSWPAGEATGSIFINATRSVGGLGAGTLAQPVGEAMGSIFMNVTRNPRKRQVITLSTMYIDVSQLLVPSAMSKDRDERDGRALKKIGWRQTRKVAAHCPSSWNDCEGNRLNRVRDQEP